MRDGHGTLWVKSDPSASSFSSATSSSSSSSAALDKTAPAAGSAAAQRLASERATAAAAAAATGGGTAGGGKKAGAGGRGGGPGGAGAATQALRKVYAGNWREGKRDGMGVQYYPDGSRYEGVWHQNQRQGKGTLYMANGSVFTGDWHQNLQCGFGTLVRANQDVYEGEWLNGKREGQGIYYYRAREKVYDGEWVSDMPKCGVSMAAADFFSPGDDGADADLGMNVPVNPVTAEAAGTQGQNSGRGANSNGGSARGAAGGVSAPGPLSGSAAANAVQLPAGVVVPFAERLRLAQVAAQPELTTNTAVPAPLKLGAMTLTSSQRRQAFRLLFRPMPALALADADVVLANEIAAIQDRRRAARNMPFVDLAELFSSAGLDDLRRIYAFFDQQARVRAAEAARPHALAPAPALRAPKGVPPSEVPAMLREVGFSVTAEECAVLMGDRGKPAHEVVTFEDFVKLTHLCDAMKAMRANELAAAAAAAATAGGAAGGEVGFSDSLLARAMGAGSYGAARRTAAATAAGLGAGVGQSDFSGSTAFGENGDGDGFDGADAELMYRGHFGHGPGVDDGEDLSVFADMSRK